MVREQLASDLAKERWKRRARSKSVSVDETGYVLVLNSEETKYELLNPKLEQVHVFDRREMGAFMGNKGKFVDASLFLFTVHDIENAQTCTFDRESEMSTNQPPNTFISNEHIAECASGGNHTEIYWYFQAKKGWVCKTIPVEETIEQTVPFVHKGKLHQYRIGPTREELKTPHAPNVHWHVHHDCWNGTKWEAVDQRDFPGHIMFDYVSNQGLEVRNQKNDRLYHSFVPFGSSIPAALPEVAIPKEYAGHLESSHDRPYRVHEDAKAFHDRKEIGRAHV